MVGVDVPHIVVNDSRHPLSSPGDGDHGYVMSDTTSYFVAMALHVSFTIFCFCLVASCLTYVFHRYLCQREERDKLCDIISTRYWAEEEKISQVVQLITKMQGIILFQDVTAYHILGYKYRCDSGVYGSGNQHSMETKLPHPYISNFDVFAILKKIERLFDSLVLQLVCRGKCPQRTARTFSATIFGLAQVTSLVWSDHKARGIQRLVRYFAGRSLAETFEASLISDADLAALILSKVPYAADLYLNVDHFVLKDVEISADVKIDLKSKIRYVDTVLAKDCSKMFQAKEKQIADAYSTAKEICLKHGFVQSKTHFPDISAKSDESKRASECVTYIRHLIRLMCHGSNMKKMETDDTFFQFLMHLHETLYNWVDAHTMLEVIERTRNNIMSYLHVLTVDQIMMDREFTKAKLEQIEKDLYRHLNYLTIHQVQQEKEKRKIKSKRDIPPRIYPAESEASVYTMALSSSSYAIKQQALHDQPPAEGCMYPYQQSIEQGSIVSGSSLYATAASLSSYSETMMPPLSRPVSQKSPSGPASDNESEFFETPV